MNTQQGRPAPVAAVPGPAPTLAGNGRAAGAFSLFACRRLWAAGGASTTVRLSWFVAEAPTFPRPASRLRGSSPGVCFPKRKTGRSVAAGHPGELIWRRSGGRSQRRCE